MQMPSTRHVLSIQCIRTNDACVQRKLVYYHCRENTIGSPLVLPRGKLAISGTPERKSQKSAIHQQRHGQIRQYDIDGRRSLIAVYDLFHYDEVSSHKPAAGPSRRHASWLHTAQMAAGKPHHYTECDKTVLHVSTTDMEPTACKKTSNPK